ncbi:porin family protein [Francisellaceae bacterium]|nr:porin family protein [Francisellaceae bacterium]MDA7742300.1 porin family protein [Francisellaceae bacterium]
MKKKFIATAMISTLLCIGVSFANDARAVTGITFGGQVGVGAFIGPNTIFGSAAGMKNGGLVLRGSVGYNHALNKRWSVGVETGISNGFDLIKMGPIGISDFSVPLLATLSYTLPSGWNFFTKAGIGFHKYTLSAGGQSESGGKIHIAPEIAMGVGYQIGKLNIYGQYTQTIAKFLGAGNGNLGSSAIATSSITAGVTYTLPM